MASSHPAIRVLLAVLVLSCATDALALSPHNRRGVVAGVAAGLAPGKVSLFPGNVEQQVTSDWKSGVTPQYRIGYAVVKDHLVVTVANQQWLYEQGILAEDKLRVNVQNWNLELTWYPANPRSVAGGLHIRAGAGLANGRLTLLEPLEDDPYGNKFEEIYVKDEGGSAYQLGVGFEFRILPTVAAGASAGFVYQSIGSELFDDAWSWPMNLTVQWYW